MTVGNQQIEYVVERDKVGAYVLPKKYVGASSNAFVLRSEAHFPLKLRLDAPVNAYKIELIDDLAGGRVYPFVRVNGR